MTFLPPRDAHTRAISAPQKARELSSALEIAREAETDAQQDLAKAQTEVERLKRLYLLALSEAGPITSRTLEG